MRDRLEDIAARAVDLSERDERAPEIVPATIAELQRLEIEAQRLRRFLAGPLRSVPRRYDEIGY